VPVTSGETSAQGDYSRSTSGRIGMSTYTPLGICGGVGPKCAAAFSNGVWSVNSVRVMSMCPTCNDLRSQGEVGSRLC